MSTPAILSKGITVLAFLVLAGIESVAHAQVLFDPDCSNKRTYPALGFTLCVRAGDKDQPFDPAALHLNSTFRIPGKHHAPRVVEREKGEEPCGGDRCYGQAMIGWTPEIATCARGVRIGLISSGIDSKHPVFAAAHFSHSKFASSQATRTSLWNGTALLALLAGTPKGGVAGLVPDAQFLVADAYFADRDGRPMADTVTLLKTLSWMRASQVQIVLLDAVLPRDELIEGAVSDIVKAGGAFVMPASEEGDTAGSYPNVIAVTAVDKDMAAYEHSSRSGSTDLAAPGVDIWTALPGNKYGYVSGNSFAAAHAVAALAAAYRSVPDGTPTLQTKEQFLARLPVKELGAGYGRGLVLAPTGCIPRLIPVTPSLMRMPAGDWK